MQPPFTAFPLDAVMIAHSSLGATLTAVLWRRPLRPWPATVILLAAIWLAVSIPIEPDVLRGMGVLVMPDHAIKALKLTSMLACVAMLVARPRWIFLVAVVFKYGLNRACDTVVDSNAELAGLHLMAFGVLIGLHYLAAPRAALATWASSPAALSGTTKERSFVRQDVVIFALVTALASIVCVYVVLQFCNSGDEWADTYQAQLFAHFKAYTTPPPCPTLFQNYWVFFYQGRAFVQYTPGWPLVMAPFQRLGIVWLASPVMLGATSVACARLARRAVSGLGETLAVERRTVAAAGFIAAALSTLGASMLLTAGSRYPHVMICACFAWAVEGLVMMSPPRGAPLRPRAQWLWGSVVGTATSLMISARPGDGATLGFGIFLFFLYALLQLRIGWRAVLATALTFALFMGLTLVILRLQLGEWFKTGYSIADLYWAFAKLKMSMPKPNEWKYGAPFGFGSYCWWPCAPALGAAGLVVALRGRGRSSALMLGCGAISLTVFCVAIEFGRGNNPGYGPRFHLPLVVSMAVGGAVLLAPLWSRARAAGRSALVVGGPAAVAVVALLGGTLRIVPLIYPEAHSEVYKRSAPLRAIARDQVHHAVVTVGWNGETQFDPLDLTQNLPLVDDPDVLILLPRHGPEEDVCWKNLYGDRYIYKAVGIDESTLIPIDK